MASYTYNLLLYMLVTFTLAHMCKGQGFLTALTGKKGWLLDRTLAEFPPGMEGSSPFTNRTLSLSCHTEMVTYGSALATQHDWAARMFDADPQIPAGIMSGHLDWIGQYEQCAKVKATGVKVTVAPGIQLTHSFDAKYCRSFYQADSVSWSLGSCVPDSCSEDDVQTILVTTTNSSTDVSYPIYQVICERERTFDVAGIVCTVVLVILGIVLVSATTADLVIKCKSCKAKEKAQPVSAQLDQMSTECSQQECSAGPPSTGAETTVTVADNEAVSSSNAPKALESNRVLQALLCFSLLRNIPRLLSTEAPKGAHTCMYGIRSLTMMWIVLGHTWQLGISVNGGRRYHITENQFSTYDNAHFSMEAIYNMSVAVESFFVLSASLVTLSLLRQFEKPSKRCMQMALYVLHRYWRLTPVLAVSILLSAGYFSYFARGPLLPDGALWETSSCQVAWWTNLLYINNFVGFSCLGWTWYLANDFQFYLAAPLFVILLAKYPKAGCVVLALAFTVSLVINGILNFLLVQGKINWFTDYYSKPYVRFSPYAVGILLGFVMYKTQCKIKMPKWLVVVCWAVAWMLLILSVYGSAGKLSPDVPQTLCPTCKPWPSPYLYSAYQACMRSMFALSVAWIILACTSGYGGPVNAFLSWSGFVPLGKLTYVCYLIHPLVIYYVYYTSHTLIYVNNIILTVYYAGFLAISYFGSVFFSAAFEMPFLELEKVIFPSRRK